MKRIILCSLLVFALSVVSYAQYFDLENQVPGNWSTSKESKLSVSGTHYKKGKQSIRWDWKNNSELKIDNPIGINIAQEIKNGGLRLWIYNEHPIDQKIVFELGCDDESAYQFEYGINFKGWRACWIRFADMTGNRMEDLNFMKVCAPKNVKSGSLFFDRMIFPSEPLERRMTPDAQLPYINPRAKNNHWTALWHWYSSYQHDLPLPISIQTEENEAMLLIHDRIIAKYQGKKPGKKEIEKINKSFKKFDIERSKGQITGKPFVSKDEYDAKAGEVKMDHIGPVLLKLAQCYFHTKNADIKEKFIDLLDYTMDQGLALGSGFGTNHHYGYQFREYPPAIYLMKEELKKAGKLKEVSDMINYWTGVQEYREKAIVGELQGVVDSWNTSVVPRLVAIMTMDDSPEKIRELRAIKRWMDISLKIVPGTMGGIKADGTGFHHGGFYPAYCKGGYSGIGEFLSLVNDTPFALSDEARLNFGNALLCMRNYSNQLDWGFGICGRHPLSGSMSKGVLDAFAHLANSGKPFTDEKIWKEMAEAFLRLEIKNNPLKKKFVKLGIEAEASPEGNYTYNYGALGIHRRGNWTVSVKGYNKNVWGSEIYVKDNRYGRYQSYGTVQVIGNKNSLTSEGSGFVQEGWDWNRYPGATSIHLPLQKLDSPEKRTLMEKSKEGFAGASNLLGENGIFGIKLREKNRTNFTGDHQANKSVFCFGDKIICLGSNISNSNKEYPTETTMFQGFLNNQADPVFVDGESNVNFPFDQSLSDKRNHSLMDAYGNGYWIRKGSNVKIARQHQESRHNKTRKKTSGDFASAWINHGVAPRNQSYEYVLFPSITQDDLASFSNGMNTKSAAYKILAQDSINHIVWDRESNTTGFVFFEKKKQVNHQLVRRVSSSSLLMIKENGDELILSMCDPDLHLEESAYTTRKESQIISIQVELNGIWELDEEESNVEMERASDNTQLTFHLKDGQPLEIKLKK